MYKKITLCVVGILLLMYGSLSAQNEMLQKGKLVMGGGLNWNYTATNIQQDGQSAMYNSTPKFSINISPMAMYMVINKLAIGTILGYEYGETKGYNYITNVMTKQYSNTGFITPTARYYFPVTEKFFFHIDLQVPIAFGETYIKESNFDGGSAANPNVATTKNINISIAILPGMTYMVSKKIGLFANVLPLNIFSMNRTQNMVDRTISNAYSSIGNMNINEVIRFSSFSIGANIYF